MGKKSWIYLKGLSRQTLLPPVTACRKEEKSVVFQRTWLASKNTILRGDRLRDFEGVRLNFRDNQPEVGKNETFNFYEKKADFKNGDGTTKNRVPYRFYLVKEQKENAGNKKVSVARSGLTSDRGWLELKIKDPSKVLSDGVFKLRARVSDQDMRHLFDFDPRTASFGILERIKSRAVADP